MVIVSAAFLGPLRWGESMWSASPAGGGRLRLVRSPDTSRKRDSMSMQGKVVVITGANSGVGLETAVGVAAQGATTVLACRNQAKAEAAANEVIRRTWNDDVHIVSLDLADLASVGKAADEILTRWDRLDVLDNNAGGTWTERQETAQGLEDTMGVCHLGHFYLTRLLLDRLSASAPS